MGALRIGPIAFLSICGALPSGMGISVQKEKNEGLLTVIITDGASPSIVFLIKAARMANSSFCTPYPRMPPFENRLFRLWSKKVGEKFGGTNKKPYLCTRKSNKASSLCLARQYAFHDLHSK